MSNPVEKCTDPIFPSWDFAAAGPAPARVEWFAKLPLSFVGAWEPLAFRRRAGYAFTDEETFFDQEYSDTSLRHYRDAGANAIVVPFAKGFGLKASAEEIAHERDTTRRARKLNLKVGVYIRVDCVIPELVVQDCPDVYDWLARRMDGRPGTYAPQQTFRKRVCQMQPGAIAWLERLFEYAVTELHADFLHLDGFLVSGPPWDNCRCELCTASWRNWLKSTLANPSEFKRVLGIADLDRIEIPTFQADESPPPMVCSADIQLWYRYLWDREVAFARHVRRFALSLKPDLAITANPGWSRSRFSPTWNGCEVERLLPWLDAIWLEEGFPDGEDKGLRSRLGFFKTAREYGIPVCHYHWQTEANKAEASLALSLAANGGNPSCLDFTFRYLPHFSLMIEQKRRFTKWAAAHRHLLSDTQPWGEIALLRHPCSLAWNIHGPHAGAECVEQLLIQMRVAWRVFDRIDPDKLRTVRTLILPDVECLSNGELEVLHRWIDEGGRVLMTPQTACFDEYRRRRPYNGLLEKCDNVPLSQMERSLQWYRWSSRNFVELEAPEAGDDDSGEAFIYSLGKGLLGYWPGSIGRMVGHRTDIKFGDQVFPETMEGVETFLRLLHGPLAFEIQAPASLLAEWNFQPKTGELLLHLIRTDDTSTTCPVDVRTPDRSGDVRIFMSDVETPADRVTDRLIRFSNVGRYTVIAFPYET